MTSRGPQGSRPEHEVVEDATNSLHHEILVSTLSEVSRNKVHGCSLFRTLPRIERILPQQNPTSILDMSYYPYDKDGSSCGPALALPVAMASCDKNSRGSLAENGGPREYM